ncbi:bacterial low temperature requirement A protein-domain-containing protein [Dichotomocladium elegans]|nr:bacterial low temperature requirement A protein-domain-containing protein [Dichotomocladium elegans]
MSTRKGTMRRGPTMRGRGGYRPPIGARPSQRRNQNYDDEEFLALNSTREDDLEMEQIEFRDQRKSVGSERPLYRHGDETFGDVISHPIEEFHAHRERRKTFMADLNAWKALSPEEKLQMQAEEAQHHEHDYILVLHFRQLRGNQGFALDHDRAEEFAKLLNLSPDERIRFNGVHDTDGLTAFLYKIKREFSIKIHHHKSDHGDHQHHHDLEHNHNNHTMEFNENLYVEFKPRSNYVHYLPPVEETRRPFFQHPEPDLSADIGEEKAASWLELFYDLFYVATLTEFTHSHVIKDWSSLGTYAQWFIITWWAWCASSLYTARFNTDDVVHHIWKLIEMCAVISMAGTAQHFLTSPAYVYGYIALKAVLVIEYSIVLVVALMAGSKSRIALAFYVGANLISIALWGASLAILEQSTHRILWYLGILTEVLVNVISRGDRTLSWAASNLAERLGLLTLIVLGENLIGLIGLVAASGLSILIMAPNWMAVVIIFGFFFMYFEDFTKEVFLHSKHHQIWVYLHFPLHLCQVAFGIALINTLKVYRSQLIEDGKLSEEESSQAGAHGATPSGSESHGTSTESHGSGSESHGSGGEAHGSNSAASPAPSHSEAASAEGNAGSAHKLARRAIESTSPSEDHYYTHQLRTATSIRIQQHPQQSWQDMGYLTLFTSVLSTVAYSTIQMVSNDQMIDAGNQTQHHHLSRRSGGEELQVDFSEAEKVFIYKTFLIMGGAILVLNSFIKLVNTKLTDIYGKIIIGSRILNAIVLWSMCALPFSQLHAFVLLSVMMGSLILQALVDLLD